jgi:hypothetical protein
VKETEIKEEILFSYSKENTIRVARLINRDEALFCELIKIFSDSKDIDLAKRAAWVLSHCVRKNPYLINPYIKKLIKVLNKPSQHDAIKRNGLKALELTSIPENHFGKIAEICFRFISSGKEAIAIKAYSIGILDKIGDEIPEIRQELKLVLQELMPYESAGFKSRARKVLSK